METNAGGDREGEVRAGQLLSNTFIKTAASRGSFQAGGLHINAQNTTLVL